MKYGNITLGQIEALVNKLGGTEGVARFLRGEFVVKVAEKFFPTWKIIKLGTGLRNADDFRQALKSAGCNSGDWVRDILGKSAFSVATSEIELELVVVSSGDLGYTEAATRADIYARAQTHGLSVCPAEVGPQLRLQYKDQPNGEWCIIAMEPIAGSDGVHKVFDVKRDGFGLWLDGSYGHPGSLWAPGSRWVFCRRK
jgi:hypothetical protein